MFEKIENFRFNNLAWLSENCVASFSNYFVIGKLNEDLGFDENRYLKFRFVDFEKFALACESVINFLADDKALPLSTAENEIVKTGSYNICWEGVFCVDENVKKVYLIAKFTQQNTFRILFDLEDFATLINGFVNISIDVFVLCIYSKSVLKFFIEKVLEQNNIEHAINYVTNLNREECKKQVNEICNCLEIPQKYSFFITDQMMVYKFELLIIARMRKLSPTRFMLFSQEEALLNLLTETETETESSE